jgi:nickel-dependent lactate racemase
VNYGQEQVGYEVAADDVITTRPTPAAVADVAEAMRAALAEPVEFPALRRALTPDDHVAVVVDESLPHLLDLLMPILNEAVAAGVTPEALTLVCPRSAGGQRWADDLPEELEDVHVEVIDPADRRHLSYLATMEGGRRLYLNRTVVDAEQVVVLSACRYDPLLGHTGAEAALYPALSDEATRKELDARVSRELPDDEGPWPAREEATEAAWLLGQPFFVQVIAAAGDGVSHVVAGGGEASAEARRLLDEAWEQTVPRPADVVVAALSGDPARHTFADLAAAAANAARVVRPGGRIVVLSRAAPDLGPGGALLLAADEPEDALRSLERQPTREYLAARLWAQAASHTHITLLSGLPDDTVEELFATPLQDAAQAQRLLTGACLFLADAHQARTVLADDTP